MIKILKDFSNFIPQNIGVKQGCPLRPLLFNLTIQGLVTGLDKMDAGYTFSS